MINKQPGQVEQPGKPGHHRNKVQGFQPHGLESPVGQYGEYKKPAEP
jgi:hypothetical protein